MSREEIHKLLGGYATGTLTPEEQQTLFEAALNDQELFDALAAEQPLRELLDDPAARAQLLAAIDDPPVPWYRRWWRPLPIAVLSTALAVGMVVAVWQTMRPAPPVRIAKVELPVMRPNVVPAPMPAAPPALPPAPVTRPAAPSAAPFSLPAGIPAPVPPPPPPARSVLAAPRDARLDKDEKSVDVLSAAAAVNDAKKSFSASPPSGLPLAVFPRTTAPIHGTVTDPTGAAIRSATVEVKSLGTGEVQRKTTGERGEFDASVLPGQAYEVTATAPGFRTRTVSTVTPAVEAPKPLELQLDVGLVTETVTIAEATPAGARAAGGGGGGRGGRGGGQPALGGIAGSATAPVMKKKEDTAPAAKPAIAPQAQAAPSQQGQFGEQRQQSQQQPQFDASVPRASGARAISPSLQFKVLSRMPGGELLEAGADGAVPAGVNLILRVTAYADGFVRVVQSDGHEIVRSRSVRGGQPWETQLGKFKKGQNVELQLIFSRQPFDRKARPSDDVQLTVPLKAQ